MEQFTCAARTHIMVASRNMLLLAACMSLLAGVSSGEAQLPPVILVPGFAGSLLQADVNRQKAVNSLCMLKGESKLWFDAKNFVPMLIDCWAEEMRLRANLTAALELGRAEIAEAEGVHVHTMDYGSVPESLFDYGQYHGGNGIWMPTIFHLQKLGYDESQIFAAPYDWRQGPASWREDDWPRLKRFAEEKVKAAGGQPAVFIAVSQGGPYFAGFLHHAYGVDAEWKQQYVAAFISNAGVYGGTIAGLGLGLWGDARSLAGPQAHYDLKVDYVGRSNVKKLLRGWGGLDVLMPFISKESARAHTLIELPTFYGGNVTDESLLQVLLHVSPEFGALYKLASQFPVDQHPGVKTVCLFGTGLESPLRYVYSDEPTASDADDGASGDIMQEASKVADGKKPDFGKVMLAANELANELLQADDTEGAESNTSRSDSGEMPADAFPGALQGEAWNAAVAKFLEGRRPDTIVTTPGDGLVPETALSVCERWTGLEPMVPDVQVQRIPGASHGSELFNPISLRKMRATVAQIAGVEDSTDDSDWSPGGERPNGKTDMKRPLGEFAQYVGPEIASWSCPKWAHIYGMVDGKDVVESGCRAELVLKSPACNEDCKRAFQNDAEFLRRRCPETCKGKANASANETSAADAAATQKSHDLLLPLSDWEAFVGPAVASWSCPQWASIYGTGDGADVIQSSCSPDFLLKSPSCDAGCHDAIAKDRCYLSCRCPDTCGGFTKDLKFPLEEFAQYVGPDVASWDCLTWAKTYRTADDKDVIEDGCRADSIMSSSQCDEGCRSAFGKDPFFLLRRCPEACGASARPKQGSLQSTAQKPAANLTCSQCRAAFVPALARGRCAKICIHEGVHPEGFLVPKSDSPSMLAAVGFGLLAACVMVTALAVAGCASKMRAAAPSGSSTTAESPLHIDGDFSEFEGHSNTSWWEKIFGSSSGSSARQVELT